MLYNYNLTNLINLINQNKTFTNISNHKNTCNNIYKNVIHSFKIGNVFIPNNLLLAPMAGVTDGPFRLICQTLGAGLTYSELVNARALINNSKPTLKLVNYSNQPRPFVVQIFGSDPIIMAEAAKKIQDLKIADIIDINMGCPVSKVVKTGAGAHLMKNIKLAESIIKSIVNSVSLPVTVKFRLGWSWSELNYIEFTKMAIDCGVAAITIHARTRQDGYSGKAQWQYFEKIQDLCGQIPFIANGDISKLDDLITLKNLSGCTAFMIGRAAIGKPWIFSELLLQDTSVINFYKHFIYEWHFKETLLEHGSKGPALFRVHLFNYLKYHHFASSLRRKLSDEKNPQTILKVGYDFLRPI